MYSVCAFKTSQIQLTCTFGPGVGGKRGLGGGVAPAGGVAWGPVRSGGGGCDDMEPWEGPAAWEKGGCGGGGPFGASALAPRISCSNLESVTRYRPLL